MACCGADLMPLRWVSTPTHGVITFASSAPVTTAMTPGAFFASAVVDVFDARVRMRRAHEGDMHHARQHDVADILAASLRQPRQIGPRHRAADIGIRPVERGKAGRLIVGDFHVPLTPPLAGGGAASRGDAECDCACDFPTPARCAAALPLQGRVKHHKNRVGHISVRHMCGGRRIVEAEAFFGLLEVAADDVDEVVEIDLGVRDRTNRCRSRRSCARSCTIYGSWRARSRRTM